MTRDEMLVYLRRQESVAQNAGIGNYSDAQSMKEIADEFEKMSKELGSKVLVSYEYQTINVSFEPELGPMRRPSIQSAANRWAENGYRTVAVMPSQGPGYSDAILIEREV